MRSTVGMLIFLGLVAAAGTLVVWLGGSAPSDVPKESPRTTTSTAHPTKTTKEDGPPTLTWADLSGFEYVPVDLGGTDEQFPQRLRGLDGKLVHIEGHMTVIDVEGGERITRFILSRFLKGCCYERTPELTDWVMVEMTGENVTAPVGQQIIRVRGTFSIGEVRDDVGNLMSLYRLRADEVTILKGVRR